MQILVAKEKYDTYYYAINDKAQLARTCIQLIKEHKGLGYYYGDDDEEEANKILADGPKVYTDDRGRTVIPAWNFIDYRSDYQYESVDLITPQEL